MVSFGYALSSIVYVCAHYFQQTGHHQPGMHMAVNLSSCTQLKRKTWMNFLWNPRSRLRISSRGLGSAIIPSGVSPLFIHTGLNIVIVVVQQSIKKSNIFWRLCENSLVPPPAGVKSLTTPHPNSHQLRARLVPVSCLFPSIKCFFSYSNCIAAIKTCFAYTLQDV